ncbi:DUF7344 domain-containing protein [Halobacterium zhouii]|uniref:DUF7344 domain-containing protein n=1 Tax=Halobacterium zhouii TaxID=2902624 RepID=UPI001E55D753|nr:hypothetical protein [Halobacterium zhouii]
MSLDDISADVGQSTPGDGATNISSGEADALFSCLADARRRAVLECLAERSEPVALDDLADHVASAATEPDRDGRDAQTDALVSLIHVDIPKLQHADVVEVNRDADVVSPSDRFAAAEALRTRL